MRLESYQLLMLGGINSRIKNGKDGFSSMMNSNGRIYPPVVECVCIVNRLLVCEDMVDRAKQKLDNRIATSIVEYFSSKYLKLLRSFSFV